MENIFEIYDSMT